LPGAFVLFVRIRSLEIEEQLVGMGLLHKVDPIGELFNLIELGLYQAVNGLHIGLEGMCPGRYGAVDNFR
jgi:hypothetical protein